MQTGLNGNFLLGIAVLQMGSGNCFISLRVCQSGMKQFGEQRTSGKTSATGNLCLFSFLIEVGHQRLQKLLVAEKALPLQFFPGRFLGNDGHHKFPVFSLSSFVVITELGENPGGVEKLQFA